MIGNCASIEILTCGRSKVACGTVDLCINFFKRPRAHCPIIKNPGRYDKEWPRDRQWVEGIQVLKPQGQYSRPAGSGNLKNHHQAYGKEDQEIDGQSCRTMKIELVSNWRRKKNPVLSTPGFLKTINLKENIKLWTTHYCDPWRDFTTVRGENQALAIFNCFPIGNHAKGFRIMAKIGW